LGDFHLDALDVVFGRQQASDVVAVERLGVGSLHGAGDDVYHVLDEVPGVDDPRPLVESFADEVGVELAGVEQLEGRGPHIVGVAAGDVVVGVTERPARVGDVVDDQHVLALDAPLGHGVANLGVGAFRRRADVVFHLQAGEVVQPEEVTATPTGEPATAGQGDDDVGVELRGPDLVGDVPTEAVDVLPVGDGAGKIVREIAHTTDCDGRGVRTYDSVETPNVLSSPVHVGGMETRRTLLIDAFADEPLAGNVAGVVPDATGLDAEQMVAIARELGASETAFLFDDGDADRRVRYFTPEQEVDLCGHATVASLVHLDDEGGLDEGRLRTNAGVLDVEVTDEGVAWLETEDPSVETVDVDYERVGEALGIDPAAMQDVGADLPAAVASVGLPFLLVPVNFLERLGEADPDMAAVAELAEAYDATGVYAFTFDALDADSTLHARMWAPGAGVPEDPVTGTASGACGAYLHTVDAFDDPPASMRFEQGHFVDRPGLVHVEVDGETVRVGGRAVTSLDGTLAVPPADEDDILEA